MKISNDTANVLGNSVVEESVLYLPEGQLDRKLYQDVNKVLVAIGGKWNRKQEGHIFDSDPSDKLDQILLSGEYTNEKTMYQFFETPPDIAELLIEKANIETGQSILEPSAGNGSIVDKIYDSGFNCDCIEINPKCREVLKAKNYNIVADDFLKFEQKYDIIIANPPFTKKQDIDHVTHMIALANCRVVSIMSASILFRTNKKTENFRKLIDNKDGKIEELPEKSFKESGTNVNACIVIADI